MTNWRTEEESYKKLVILKGDSVEGSVFMVDGLRGKQFRYNGNMIATFPKEIQLAIDAWLKSKCEEYGVSSRWDWKRINIVD